MVATAAVTVSFNYLRHSRRHLRLWPVYPMVDGATAGNLGRRGAACPPRIGPGLPHAFADLPAAMQGKEGPIAVIHYRTNAFL